MTAQTTVSYSDDLGGAGAATPLVFSVEGVQHEIHLNKRNMETFLRRLAPYTSVSRPPASAVESTRGSGSSRRKSEHYKYTAAVRAWAVANGHKIGTKGRIPSEITAAYEAR